MMQQNKSNLVQSPNQSLKASKDQSVANYLSNKLGPPPLTSNYERRSSESPTKSSNYHNRFSSNPPNKTQP